MDPYQVILEPIMTEKSVGLRGEKKYAFRVDPRATKIDIKSAVAKLFKVTPLTVNTIRVKGKARMMGYRAGRTASYKKAYIMLKEGQKIEELEI